MNGVYCQHQYSVHSLLTRGPKLAQNSDHCVDKLIVVCIGIKSALKDMFHHNFYRLRTVNNPTVHTSKYTHCYNNIQTL